MTARKKCLLWNAAARSKRLIPLTSTGNKRNTTEVIEATIERNNESLFLFQIASFVATLSTFQMRRGIEDKSSLFVSPNLFKRQPTRINYVES